MLRAVPKEIEDAAPNRIGFRLVEDLENTDPATPDPATS
jgi:hypothetical protein